MTVYNWLCLLGIPAMISFIFGYVIKRIKKNDAETTAVKSGIQALLRDRLISVYRENAEKGYADIQARENFENMYKQYHSLGANGVMDDIRHKFLGLPTIKTEG